MNQVQSAPLFEDGRKASPEDLFRREAFAWALATKKFVAASQALHPTSRVAATAMADVEHARTMLKDLIIPSLVKGSANAESAMPTVGTVRSAVAGMAYHLKEQQELAELARSVAEAFSVPMSVLSHSGQIPHQHTRDCDHTTDDQWLAYAADAEAALVKQRTRTGSRVKKAADLSAPVHSKDGKMLWAEYDCSKCPAKAHERCKNFSGGYLEKPHTERIVATGQFDSILLQH